MQLLRFLLVPAAVFGLAFAPGCSGEVDRQGSLDEQSFAEKFAAESCEAAAPCCDPAGYPRSTTCASDLRDSLTEYIAELDGLQVRYDGQAAADCVAAAAAFASSCEATAEEGEMEACNRVFVGLVPEGAACERDVECAGDGDCNQDTGSGRCVIEGGRHLNQGEPCNGSCDGNACSISVGGSAGSPVVQGEGYCYRSDGLYCSEGRVCELLGGSGAGCTSSEGCVDGTYCDFLAAQCAPRRKDGESCLFSEECASGRCAGDVPSMSCAPYASSTFCEVPGE
jgi:hypothetical protein